MPATHGCVRKRALPSPAQAQVCPRLTPSVEAGGSHLPEMASRLPTQPASSLISMFSEASPFRQLQSFVLPSATKPRLRPLVLGEKEGDRISVMPTDALHSSPLLGSCWGSVFTVHCCLAADLCLPWLTPSSSPTLTP